MKIFFKKRYVPLLLCLIATVGLFRLIRTYYTWLPEPLWPDVSSYIGIAKRLESPYYTDNREPLWIWYVWIFTRIFGDGRFSLLMMGGASLFISAFFYFKLVKELFSDVRIRLLALFIFLNNGLLLVTTINATRDCLFLSGLIALSYYLFSVRATKKGRLLGIIFSAIIIVGVRSTTLIPLLVLLSFFTWQKKWNLYTPLLSVLPAFLMNCPYYYLSYVQTGDPFYSSNIHAIYWRNYEAYLRCNQCDINMVGYSGEPVTWYQYIFKTHSLKEVLFWTWDGFARMFLLPGSLLRAMSGAVFPLLFAVYWLGLWKLVSSNLRLLFVIPLLIINVLLFTVHLNMDARLFTAAIPFTTLASTLGAITCLDYLIVLLKTKLLPSSIASHE